MNLYFASCNLGKKEIWDFDPPKNLLLSYHYENDLFKTLDYCKQKELCQNMSFMLDSGAFSAWKSGASINIKNYLKCILRIKNEYPLREFLVVNLDVIPGKQGDKITAEMSRDSMLKGWDNYLWFKKQGIETIHVFHEGEDENFLMDTIIKECKYIGVSPSNDSSRNQKMMWCERIFHLLPEEIKTHGFAVTSKTIIKKFPWHSVDSTTWFYASIMGNIHSKWGLLYYSNEGRVDQYLSDNKVLQQLHKKELLNDLLSMGIKFQDINCWEEQLRSDVKLRNIVNYCFFKRLGEEEKTRNKPRKFKDPQMSFL